jgi:hypothetical protein
MRIWKYAMFQTRVDGEAVHARTHTHTHTRTHATTYTYTLTHGAIRKEEEGSPVWVLGTWARTGAHRST